MQSWTLKVHELTYKREVSAIALQPLSTEDIARNVLFSKRVVARPVSERVVARAR